MANATEIKATIHTFLDTMDESVLVSESEKDQLRAWCDALSEHSPNPRPCDAQEIIEGVWQSRFASFGAKHSDNQPLQHESSLLLQSFGNLPNVPVRVTRLRQEIEVASLAYNNVVSVTNMAGDATGVVVMRGEYACDDDNPQRYSVAFQGVSFEADDDRDDEAFRAAFGIDADAPLAKAFKPPKLHSDIVYVDDDTRINYGGLGGFYVLTRLDEPGYSVPLNRSA